MAVSPGTANKPEKRGKDMDELNTREIDRLADWLKAQGFAPEKVLECIKYIADTGEPLGVSTPRKE